MTSKNVFIALFLYFFLSLSSVFMKFASINNDLIMKGVYYILSMLTLGVFALLWQKMLTKFNLSKVYVFKATTIIWGMILGYLFFKEQISIQMVIGAMITMIGVYIIIGDEKNE